MRRALVIALALLPVWSGVAQSKIKIRTAALPNGIVGVPYHQQLEANGATAPPSWSVTLGILPPGLQLSTDGILSGTPAEVGRYSFVVQASDGDRDTDVQALVISVFPAVSVATASLPSATVGATYSQVLAATGGTPPMQWSVSAGALPAGLHLDKNGTIGGTASAPGTQTFTVSVTDSKSATDSRALTLTVNPAIAVTTATLPPGVVGIAYQQALAASGGSGTYVWSLASGALPAGLSLSPAGAISGVPSAPGTSNFVVRAADDAGGSATLPLGLVINPALTVTTASLPAGTVGTAYQASLAATGGSGGNSWTVSAGTLPAGLSLATDGNLTGTPSTPSTATFTVQVKDTAGVTATKDLSIAVAPPQLIITTASLPAATVGTPYQATLAATGGAGGNSWTVSAGALPAGLSLATDGNLTGTPSTPGTATFTVQVKDTAGVTATKDLSIAVAPPQLIITTASLPAATVGTPYQATLAATGGAGGNNWTVSAGTLPAGLSLATDGNLTGTPSTPGTATFTVQVKDSAGVAATKDLSIAVAPPPLIITTASLPAATVGTAYQATLAATGGAGGNSWTVSAGALPAGLSLAATGNLTGTPSTPGTATFTVQVKDTAGVTATKDLSIAVAPPQLIITTASLPAATVGTPYQASLAASGGAGGNNWTVAAGTLPAGLSLAATGNLTGTPSTPGTTSFTVQVKDTAGVTATKDLTLAVASPQLTVTTTSLPAATVGAPYQASLAASGGAGGNNWTVAAGALPAGISLATDGNLTGTPSTPGTATFTVQVKDSAGVTATKDLTLAVASPQLIVTTASLPAATVGAPYQASLAASGGAGGNNWTVSAGTLPAGISLAGDGSLTGTPTAPGTTSFTVQVKDTAGVTATKDLTLAVASPQLTVTTTSLPAATVGAPYQASLAASGGTGGNNWTVAAGALPAGISLAGDGSLTGTPTAPGTSTFTVQVKDTAGAAATRDLSISVAALPLTVTTASLPAGIVGTAYQATVAASGGSGGNTWTVAAGALPAGISLAGDGSLTGTPTAPGTANFTVQVKDNTTGSATRPLSIAVSPAQLTIVTTSLPGGTAGVAYQATLSAGGGTGGYGWTVTAGSLPAGLSLSGGGSITGTPTTPGTATFTVQASDSSKATTTAALSIAIAPAPLTISTSSLPGAAVGIPYQQPLSASGGSGNYSWTIASGALPPGLALSRAGIIGGTPGTPGPFAFTVAVSAGAATTTRSFTISVESQVTVVTSALRAGTVGSPYSATLLATGGGAPYTWAVVSGQLPAGMSLDPATGTLSGVPTVAGTFRLVVQVTDSASAKATATLLLTINRALAITTAAAIATGSAGAPYVQAFIASGGIPPYTWTSSGALPAGLHFDAAIGSLSGTPTQVGTFSITVQVADASGNRISRDYSLQVVSGLAIATPPVLPPATSGVPYASTLQPAGGSSPYQWIVTAGALPGGLAFSAAGHIAGTPTSTGTFTFTAQVTDGISNRAQKEFTLVVAGPLAITSTALPPGATESPYAQTLAAAGGTPPYSWSVTAGSLPDGLTLEAPTGALAGTPAASGNFTFTASVTDANGVAAARQFTVAIAEGLAFATQASLPSATAGVPYSFAMQASGGHAPYSWTVSQGALPSGLALNGASGLISGTPSATGTFNFTVRVTDAANMAAARVHSIVVGVPPLPAISIAGLPANLPPLSQPLVDIALDNPFPVPIAGTVSLAFQPAGPNSMDDPAVQFSTGGRSATFTIPANATHAIFSAPQFAVQTGSVAGAITLNIVALQAGGSALGIPDGLTRTGTMNPSPPVIRAVSVVHTASGLEVQITGMSNTRELAQASVTFQPAPGTSIQNPQLNVPLADVANGWFQSAASAAFGGQFGLTLPFTFTGNVSISSVSVVLSNASGDSAAGSANY